MKLLGSLQRLMRSPAGAQTPGDSELARWVADNDYPVLPAHVLLRMLDQTNRIRSIERLVGTTPDTFDELYLAAIDTLVEAAQLVPASVCDHHREVGGWVDHTLEVVENALQARKRSILPPGTRPEAIHELEPVWTYAVFACALLHDAGKLISLTHLKALPCGDLWIPGGQTLSEAGVSRYAIAWPRYPYELQSVSSITLLGLLPKKGLSMLLGNQQVLRAMISTLTNDWQSGPLGDIVSGADQDSVRKYLSPGLPRTALPNAPVRPLSERLMRALRVELDEGAIRLNTNGGAGWVSDGSVWLVCKKAVQHIRERLDSEGVSDVPDDERIFDILLDQGYLVPNTSPARQSIWYVTVRCEQYAHHLTMLRFERSTLIHRSKPVDDFNGEITILDRAEMLALRQSARTPPPESPDSAPSDSSVSPAPASMRTAANAPVSSTAASHLETDSSMRTDDQDSTEPVASSPPLPCPGVQPGASSVDMARSPVDSPIAAQRSDSGKQPEQLTPIATIDAASPPAKAPSRKRKPSARDAATAAVVSQINARGKVDRSLISTAPVGLDSDSIGRYFLTWVREAVDAQTPGFEINDSEGNGLVHRVCEGMFLVHPRIIQRFVIATGLVADFPDGSDTHKSPDVKAAVDTVRTNLRKEKLLATTAKGYDVHQADVSKKKNRFVTGMLYGIVVPAWSLFDDAELPPINAAVSLWQGEYRTGASVRPKGVSGKK